MKPAAHFTAGAELVRWCWYGEEDGIRVWTAASGSFYLEVNGATGRCEIAEWDPETADIGYTLWEAQRPGENVGALQRIVEDALGELRADPFANPKTLDAVSKELRALLRSDGRVTLKDALQAAARQKLDESAALIALERLAREPANVLARYYLDRSGATPQLLQGAELRELAEQHFADGSTAARAACIEVVWATSVAAALNGARGRPSLPPTASGAALLRERHDAIFSMSKRSLSVNKISALVAERIRAERQSAGFTQTKLAELTGLQRPIVSRLESGKHTPSLQTLDRVAVALRVPLATLVTEQPRPIEVCHDNTIA